MAALCELSPGWYGLFLSWTNKENKSNLILALLEIGSDAIPWLGDLQNLTLSSHESGKYFKLIFVVNYIHNYCVAY